MPQLHRLPLSVSDFQNGIFSSVAKYLAHHWPAPSCKLSQALETLARGLGYANLHDAQKSAGHGQTAAAVTESDARLQIAAVLASHARLLPGQAHHLAMRVPILKFEHFSTRAAAPLANTPITRCRNWDELLREIAPLLPLHMLPPDQGEVLREAWEQPLRIARAITVWYPELLERESLDVDLIGAYPLQADGGPEEDDRVGALLGKPEMRVRIKHITIGLHRLEEREPSPPWRERPADLNIAFLLLERNFQNPKVMAAVNEMLAAGERVVFVGVTPDMCEVERALFELCKIPVGEIDVIPLSDARWAGADTDRRCRGEASWRVLGAPPYPRLDAWFETEQESAWSCLASERAKFFQGKEDGTGDDKDWTLDLRDRREKGAKIFFPDRYRRAEAYWRGLGVTRSWPLPDGTTRELVDLGFYLALDAASAEMLLAEPRSMPMCVALLPDDMVAQRPQAGARWIERAAWAARARLQYFDDSGESAAIDVASHALSYLVDQEKAVCRNLSSGADLARLASPWCDASDPDAPFEDRALFGFVDGRGARVLLDSPVDRPRCAIEPDHQAFFCALNQGQVEVAIAMIGATPRLALALNEDYETALHVAGRINHAGLAQCCIEAGADINALDRLGRTPLMAAALHGGCKVIDALTRQSGLQVSVPSLRGETPLAAAAFNDHPQAALQLVLAGASTDEIDPDVEGDWPDLVAALRRAEKAGKRPPQREWEQVLAGFS